MPKASIKSKLLLLLLFLKKKSRNKSKTHVIRKETGGQRRHVFVYLFVTWKCDICIFSNPSAICFTLFVTFRGWKRWQWTAKARGRTPWGKAPLSTCQLRFDSVCDEAVLLFFFSIPNTHNYFLRDLSQQAHSFSFFLCFFCLFLVFHETKTVWSIMWYNPKSVWPLCYWITTCKQQQHLAVVCCAAVLIKVADLFFKEILYDDEPIGPSTNATDKGGPQLNRNTLFWLISYFACARFDHATFPVAHISLILNQRNTNSIPSLEKLRGKKCLLITKQFFLYITRM